MKNENILKELNSLQEQAEKIVKKVEYLKKELGFNNKKSSDNNKKALKDDSLKCKFEDYLRNVSKIKERSISNYINDLKRMRNFILEFIGVKLEKEIFEMDDALELKKILDKMLENKSFRELNKKCHHHFTASLNNYIDFLGFSNNSFDFDD